MLVESVTPREYAEARGIAVDKVHRWILAGELVAINVAQSASSQRPRWRISLNAIEDFERLRQIQPAPPSTPRRKRDDPLKQYV